MKMKDVIISVTGIQSGVGGTDSLELVTPGKYGVSPDEKLLTWEESDLTGMEGTTTSISVGPAGVELRREGVVNTTMRFDPREKQYFLYDTPFGAATMGLDTHRLRHRLDTHGGILEISYVLDMEQTVVGRNRFFIQVKEPEESHSNDIRYPN